MNFWAMSQYSGNKLIEWSWIPLKHNRVQKFSYIISILQSPWVLHSKPSSIISMLSFLHVLFIRLFGIEFAALQLRKSFFFSFCPTTREIFTKYRMKASITNIMWFCVFPKYLPCIFFHSKHFNAFLCGYFSVLQ